MPTIQFDENEFSKAVTKAVQELLVRERKQLDDLTEEFLDRAKSAQRSAISDIEHSTESFQTRATAELATADTAITKFLADFEKKKTEIKDALNVKILAGFTIVVVLLSLGAVAYLGEKLEAVNKQDRDLREAARKLTDSSVLLQAKIDDANKVYATAFATGKNADVATQFPVLSALTTHMNTDLQKAQSDISGLKEQTAPIVAEWVRTHPAKTKH